jgi:PBSX family phage terminase large subunit
MSVKTLYKPSAKMREVVHDAHLSKYRLLVGPVRSGKSFVANDVALREIQELPPCNVLMSGFSISSVARNVLAEWKEMIDPQDRGLFRNVRDGKDDFMVINWRGLRGKRFYVRGAGKENDYKQIQGATFGYWYGDELTRHCESFVDMAMTRLSPPWALGTWTTNTDSPFHFVNTRFIEDKTLRKVSKSGRCLLKVWQFRLTDNPSLDAGFVQSLKQLYTGVFYKRYILSMWVVAEGAIYDFFDERENTIPAPPGPANAHYVASDYGTGAPTAFLLFGVNNALTPKVWCEREWYWDSRKQQGQLTDADQSKKLEQFLGWQNIRTKKPLGDGTTPIIPRGIYIDPSAASFKLQLRRDGFLMLKDADNDVLNGIRTQARMLKLKEYAICQCCTQTIGDYDAYVWDDKAQLKGEDKPLKQNDHTKDAERYFLHSIYGKRAIDYSQLTKWD